MFTAHVFEFQTVYQDVQVHEQSNLFVPVCVQMVSYGPLQEDTFFYVVASNGSAIGMYLGMHACEMHKCCGLFQSLKILFHRQTQYVS